MCPKGVVSNALRKRETLRNEIKRVKTTDVGEVKSSFSELLSANAP